RPPRRSHPRSARAALAARRRPHGGGTRAPRCAAPRPRAAARRARTGTSACSRVGLALAELDEEPVRVLRMHPGDVGAPAVDARARLLQALDAAGNVLALEAHEVDALAVLGQEAADRLVQIGRLQELDVADARRQDRILEAELLRLAAVMHRQAEEAREALDRGLDVTHHDGQLDDVTQHGRPPGSSARLDCSPRAWRPQPLARLCGSHGGAAMVSARTASGSYSRITWLACARPSDRRPPRR